MSQLIRSLLRLTAMHVFRLHPRPGSDKDHLEATMAWLCRAHEVAAGKGVSSAYSFRSGWKPAYPETTGYIIPTFLEYWKFTGDATYLNRAIRMGEWELEIQYPQGGVRGGQNPSARPIVFNTGQVMFGWLALHDQTAHGRYLEAARKAGDWLASIQDGDGKWSTHTYGGIPYAYHTRVAWALMELYRKTSEEKYRDAAERNIGWALSLASKDGWIDKMSFTGASRAFTHTIAYTLRGLLECRDQLAPRFATKIMGTVARAMSRILSHSTSRNESGTRPSSFLPGTFDRGWSPDQRYTCLTGNAQMAAIFLKMHRLGANETFRQLALQLIEGIKSTQHLRHPHPAIQGGVLGSYPIWGAYCPFNFPNWAAKFFADVIMLELSLANSPPAGTTLFRDRP